MPNASRAILVCFNFTFKHLIAVQKVDHEARSLAVWYRGLLIAFIEDKKQLIGGFMYLMKS